MRNRKNRIQKNNRSYQEVVAKRAAKVESEFYVACFADDEGLINLDLGNCLLRFAQDDFLQLADAMCEASFLIKKAGKKEFSSVSALAM